MVIWVTGLSGSGKSTLGRELVQRLRSTQAVVLLDGDRLRKIWGADLGYAPADRARHIQRIQALAQLLAEHGVDVVVSALYADPDLLAWNRANLPGYFEVYLRVNLALVRARDVGGVYGQGATPVVGVDIPWHAPESPDLAIDVDFLEPARAVAARVIEAIRASHIRE